MHDYRPFIADLLRQSGVIAREYFRKPLSSQTKEDASPVTHADQEIESLCRKKIEEAFPDHTIVGEEFGTSDKQSDFTWVIDPIDGTKSFMVGRPLFGHLVALLYKNTPIASGIYQSITDELWLGQTGFQTTLNGKTLKVSTCMELKQAKLATTGPDYLSATELVHFNKASGEAYFTMYGGDCYNYGLLACGYIDLIIESNLKLYDIAALIPIIEGAGAIVSNWQGKPLQFDNNNTYSIVASATSSLQTEAIRVLV